MTMSDLTDEELADEWSIEEQRHADWPGRRMIIEIRRHRAVMVRLREMALSMEHDHRPNVRSLGAELRARINGV